MTGKIKLRPRLDKEKEPEEKTFYMVVSGVVVIILLIIAIPFIANNFFSQEKTPTEDIYNNFKFIQYGGLWYTQVQTKEALFDLSFEHHPKDLEDIQMVKLSDEFYSLDEIYVTFNPDDPALQYVAVAAGKITLGLARASGIFPIAACTKNITDTTDACYGKPVLSCQNIPEDKALIQIEQSNKTSIEISDNCAIISGRNEELTRAAERFLMGMYGII